MPSPSPPTALLEMGMGLLVLRSYDPSTQLRPPLSLMLPQLLKTTLRECKHNVLFKWAFSDFVMDVFNL